MNIISRRSVVQGMGAAALGGSSPLLAATAGRRSMPSGFLWGTATSAHQTEGNNVGSDSWLNEHVKPTLFREPSGDACDSYARFDTDIALAASLGFNCHRFGIEWSRIEPEPGLFSNAALDHYLRVLESCHAHGLAPVVTFNHFTTPRWFAARGGFETTDGPDLFARYVERATARLGPLIAMATTFNEINAPRLIPVLVPAISKVRPAIARMLAASARACGSDRFSSWIFAEPDRIEAGTRDAHAKAYAVLKAGPGRFPVGISVSMQDLQAQPGGETLTADLRRQLYDHWINEEVPADFIGVQTYTRIRIGPDGPLAPPAGAEMTGAGYEYFPAALGATVRYAAGQGRRPVYITESGIATPDDARRIAFIDSCLGEVRDCLAAGVDLRGYMHWSLLDNFEWTAGYSQQFGLVAVDRTTFARTPKPSARHLGSIAKANRL